MSIGVSVINNGDWQKARRARVAQISGATPDSTPGRGGDTPRFTRRSTDLAAPTADRRGIVPAVRSPSTAIVFDQRGLDRREVADRRQRAMSVEPSSEFTAQAVAREGMLLDLRPDPAKTQQAREAYQETDADTPFSLSGRYNFTV